MERMIIEKDDMIKTLEENYNKLNIENEKLMKEISISKIGN